MVLRTLGWVVFLVAIVATVAAVAIHRVLEKDLPEVISVKDYRPPLKSRVFSQSGELIAEFGVHERIITPFDSIPERVKQAFISAEDKNFYRHHGIDLWSIIGAVWQSVAGARSTLRGASTISQQLAKGLLIKEEGFNEGSSRTLTRKIREAILARRLENALSKDEILWMYLNEVYLGHGNYGVAAAAKTYFHKNLAELSLGEVAILAGLPQAPSRFSPLANRKAALARQDYVLSRLREDKVIDDGAVQAAMNANHDLKVYERVNNFRLIAPYFSETVRQRLVELYTEQRVYEDGLTIIATLDSDHERLMQRALKAGLISIDKRQGFLGPLFRPAQPSEREQARIVAKKIDEEHLVNFGEYRVATVEHVDSVKQEVQIAIGNEKGRIGLAGMNWARVREPSRNYETSLLSTVANVLMEGDVILVKALKDGDFTLEQEPQIEGAMVSLDPQTGYITAMEGGYSFDRSEFNRVYQACRQPGSLFKPIVYASAIALKKYTPATMVLDAPLTFHDGTNDSSWRPKNFDHDYKGEVTVHEAIMRSMNIPTLNVTADVGIAEVIKVAQQFGIKSPLKAELGTGIGASCVTPFELAQVFSTFAQLGQTQEPITIKEVFDRDGSRLSLNGSALDPFLKRDDRVSLAFDTFFTKRPRVLDEQDGYIMHYLLSEVARGGTAQRLTKLNHHIAGKTGTTNDSFDVWFAGYTKNLLGLVWVGNDTMDVPLGVYEQGAKTALPIFTSFIEPALHKLPDELHVMPTGLCEAEIDEKTGLSLALPSDHSFTAPFRCGSEPRALESHPNQTLEQVMGTM